MVTTSKLQKNLVLITLFIVPLLLYIFLQMSTNNFARLPVITKKVIDINTFDKKVQFKDKISVVIFLGKDVTRGKGSLFNINQKIYKHFYGFKDFQFVVVAEDKSIETLQKKLGKFTDLSKYKFVSIPQENVKVLFDNFKTPESLDKNLYCSKAFIVDKAVSLRGRVEKRKIVLYGYNMESVGELNDKMKDDVKIVLAEYRLALKKNGAKRKI